MNIYYLSLGSSPGASVPEALEMGWKSYTVDKAQYLVALEKKQVDVVLIDATHLLHPVGEVSDIVGRGHAKSVVMMSKVSLEDHVSLLQAGATIVLIGKSPPLLVNAQVRSIVSTTAPKTKAHSKLVVFGFKFDNFRKMVSFDGMQLNISERQYELLFLLANHVGEFVSRSVIATSIDCSIEGRSIDMFINRLRKRLPNPRDSGVEIESGYSNGYRLLSSSAPSLIWPDGRRGPKTSNAPS